MAQEVEDKTDTVVERVWHTAKSDERITIV